jgi:phenol hydroxylase P2 protein
MTAIASITLQNVDDARPIIESILADNPGARVMNMPGAVKIDCDHRLVIKRDSVEKRIGRSWTTQDIHLVLISMAGNQDEDDDYFALSWNA